MIRLLLAVTIVLVVVLINTNCSPMADGYGYSADSASSEDALSVLIDGDPLNRYAWHIQNRGQKSFSTNAATRGVDVNMLTTIDEGYTGTGVRVCVADSGVESTHEDLTANMIAGASVDYSTMVWGTSADPIDDDDNHGTDVAGLIAAVSDNGKGSRGIAPNAKVASKNFLSASVVAGSAVLVDIADGVFDIYNYSWGSSVLYTFLDINTMFEAQMLDSVINQRAGKGSVFVKAAGNEFQYQVPSLLFRHSNANFDGYNTTPYTIVVGAYNAAGTKANYASVGSSLWVSAPSGQSTYPQMVTTDRTGCNKGYANVAYAGYVPSFNTLNSSLNPLCRYDVAFNGTSAATPVVAGTIALMLEAEPNLTWRDVKHILAMSSRKVDLTSSRSNAYVSSPPGHVWEQGWVENDAGFHFNNYYGFGLIDVDGAVSVAKNYTSALGTFTQSTGGAGVWDYARSGLNLTVPDNSATGVQDTMTVASTMIVEAVQIRFDITHADIGSLGIELTAPGGTKSIIINANNSLYNLPNYAGEIFISNAFYGESATGNWRIKVIDGKAGSTAAVLTGWELRFSGHAP